MLQKLVKKLLVDPIPNDVIITSSFTPGGWFIRNWWGLCVTCKYGGRAIEYTDLHTHTHTHTPLAVFVGVPLLGLGGSEGTAPGGLGGRGGTSLTVSDFFNVFVRGRGLGRDGSAGSGVSGSCVCVCVCVSLCACTRVYCSVYYCRSVSKFPGNCQYTGQ